MNIIARERGIVSPSDDSIGRVCVETVFHTALAASQKDSETGTQIDSASLLAV